MSDFKLNPPQKVAREFQSITVDDSSLTISNRSCPKAQGVALVTAQATDLGTQSQNKKAPTGRASSDHQLAQCPVDFPAAHSMDTNWFAVDADGNIGIFEPSEPGAKPVGIRGDQYGHFDTEFYAAVVAHALRTGQLKVDQHLATGSDDLNSYVLCILHNANAEELSPDYSQPMPDHPEYTIVYNMLSPINGLHAHKHCLGCCFLDHVLFAYHHSIDVGVPVPYKRDIAPAHPFNVADLAHAKDFLSDLHSYSNLHFSDRAYIQPLEHGPCDTFCRDIYLSTSGQVEIVPPHLRSPAEFDPHDPSSSLTFKERTKLAKQLRNILDQPVSPPTAIDGIPQGRTTPWWQFWKRNA